MIFAYFVGETWRRGFKYFSVNATTMIEDYLSGILLLVAAILWQKKSIHAQKFMIAAWAYSTGGMFVPFAAHLEAWIRQDTFRADHPHDDLASVILKGAIWGISLICFIISIRSSRSGDINSKLPT
jgi:hypothetical protein